ncbi:hypothetical protein RhiirC2_706828 [Rhizophagus irregularis]|uniref:Putative restriction endonuclease domain-containing protein n=1 Tax=Rhizophagus irregularis TaxID=588596 RepID=A0A2N1NTC0_9GLOM|nr:hypothetical protein RhiirC2_706828 [Rhizophagus irregularis]
MSSRIFIPDSSIEQLELIANANSRFFRMNLIEGVLDIMPLGHSNKCTTNEAYPPVTPNFIVELRSQSDSVQYIHNKMLQWMNAGAEEGWFIDQFQNPPERFLKSQI